MINYSIAILSSKPGTKKADIKETKAYGMAQSSGNVDINDCLKELLLEGKRVKLGDLGDFQARLKSKGAKTTDDFNANYIEAVNVSWEPGKPFQNLRSEASFQLVPSREAQADAIEVIRNEDTIQGLE